MSKIVFFPAIVDISFVDVSLRARSAKAGRVRRVGWCVRLERERIAASGIGWDNFSSGGVRTSRHYTQAQSPQYIQ